MAVTSKGYVPRNTQRSINWAVRVFTEWRAERLPTFFRHSLRVRVSPRVVVRITPDGRAYHPGMRITPVVGALRDIFNWRRL